jgi:hypothetical protein
MIYTQLPKFKSKLALVITFHPLILIGPTL